MKSDSQLSAPEVPDTSHDDEVCPWCEGDMRDVGAELIDRCPMCGEKL